METVILMFRESNKGLTGVYASVEAIRKENPGILFFRSEPKEPGFIYQAVTASGTKVYFEVWEPLKAD